MSTNDLAVALSAVGKVVSTGDAKAMAAMRELLSACERLCVETSERVDKAEKALHDKTAEVAALREENSFVWARANQVASEAGVCPPSRRRS